MVGFPYRILVRQSESGLRYYAERRFLFFWWVSYDPLGYETDKKAFAAIEGDVRNTLMKRYGSLGPVVASSYFDDEGKTVRPG